jgi:hypothetical protein
MSRSTYGTLAIKSIAAETTNISQTVPTTTNNGDIWYDTMFKCKENGIVRSLVNPTVSLTNKGDILTYSTTNATLPVGTAAQILIADSAQVTGVKWGDVSGITNLSINAIGNILMFPNAYENTLTYRFITIVLTNGGPKRIKSDLTISDYSNIPSGLVGEAFCYNPLAPVYKYIISNHSTTWYRSSDGITYSSYLLGTTPFTFWMINNYSQLSSNSFVYVPYYSKYYYACYDKNSNATAKLIWSYDAVNWYICPGTETNSGINLYIQSILYDETGCIICVGEFPPSPNPYMGFRSTDGITFSKFGNTNLPYGTGLYIQGTFIIGAPMRYSRNKGIDWTVTAGTGTFGYSPELNMLIMTSYSGSTYQYITDFINFTIIVGGTIPGPARPLITWCNPYWVAINRGSSNCYISLNGISWTAGPVLNAAALSIHGFYAITNS